MNEVNRDVVARVARSGSLSRWFRYPAAESEHHYRGFITDADLDLLVAMGVTAVRLAVDPRYLNLAYVDEAVARLTGRGLVVVFDYHDESRTIEGGPAALKALERAWAALAAHLARFPPDRLLLEIFNEPVFDRDPAAWFPVRRRLAAAIRAAAPLHTIVAGGPQWSSLDGLLAGRPLEDDNVLYTFHFYEPFEFTHQGAPWVQGPVGRMRNVRYPATPQQARHVECRIAAAAEWARRHDVPVWAGEFGAYPPHAPKNDRLRWLYDVRTALERHGVGWAVWSYDESLGLDRAVDESGSISLDWDSAVALGLRIPGAIV
jgi:hypothetical protein